MSDENAYLEKQKTKKQIKTQRRAAYYQALWTAWFEHRMELDKQLLTLSALAIGLLMFFRDDLKNMKELPEKLLWIFAGGSFITTIILILIIFHRSSEHIKCMMDEDSEDRTKEEEWNNKLKKLDKKSRIAFISAVSATFALATLSVFMVTVCELTVIVYEFIMTIYEYILVL